ncbi:hypothetical protein WCD74_25070 [Actinomycetospora sp. OC33-EN08]|uniref:Uncharacterized protein n=1 Tax=Actinomycetospora aurantiaca TaxID=3129233 RepID=A0ABU8MUR2_9PSEU
MDRPDAGGPPTLALGAESLALEMRTVGDELAVRLGGVEVRGGRRGGWVDWAFPVSLPDGGLRLRQRLAAVPTRRTLTAADGSAWLVQADHGGQRWTGELPVGTTALDAALVLWTCAALDQVGVEHCYPVRRRLSVPVPPPGRWLRVGGRVRRPDPPDPPSG